tara:strand:+ start:61 stop:1086 length:1026 start_codon:yes stop_codon:yes gene_type:complete
MNKLSKLGVTALCGSLAAAAANAGSMSVSGGAALTWTSEGGAVTGNPIGMKNNLTFGAAGELDNGWTWRMNAYQSDANTLTSSNWSMTMDSLGTLSFDFGAGGSGLDALDDKMPTAWEETHGTGAASGVDTISGVHGSAHIQYKTPTFAGTTLAIAWAPVKDGGGLQADLGNSGDLDNRNNRGLDVVIQSNVSLGTDILSGLNMFVGASRVETNNTDGGDDHYEGTAGFTYALGPITVGLQKMGELTGSDVRGATGYYNSLAYGVSFNVSDNIALSYGYYESKRDTNADAATTVDLDIESIQLSYTLGSLGIKLASTEVANASYSTGSDAEATTLALSLAF